MPWSPIVSISLTMETNLAVSDTMMANASEFTSLGNKQINIESMNSDSAGLNVGNVQVGTTESGMAPALPEVGKGSIIDIMI